MLDDESFQALFPQSNLWKDGDGGTWEHDPRWLLLTVAISAWLKEQTGLPVDFQIQPMSAANKRHKGPRNALGMRIKKQQSGED